ncbi:putative hydroxymethylpyrimidine transporter CytX [Asticcacaulis sp. EMRT-3]|uniref:putative hydroxymethylpyrimidine transporter CytX n=1 Tax=Asticcacaulis sp. EMRT-3 TaxID=3040349 RepID=UPI0024AEAEDE|nr:putative hydroxymethylpyrimidine transporter CytX [Asticcacaulis sp. EMRT-3]MDI7774185.1 putative hydroxymethylpyrimidine transporter CytX [Asticcacaulis sp. EMRT-3]
MAAEPSSLSDHDAYDPLTPVPPDKRTLSGRDAFSLWFSLGIGLLVLQGGALLVPGLSLAQAFAAILIGSAVGAVLLALAGVVGADTGLATIAALRPALGVRGAHAAAVLNVVQLIGWGAFEIIVMRDAANTLSGKVFGVSLPVVWTLLFGAAATGLAVMGPLSFVRRFLRHWGLWILLLGAAWMTVTLLRGHDWVAMWHRAGTGALSLPGGIDLVVAMPLSWLPLIADYARFGKTAKGVFRGSASGYVLANIWFYALGAAYGLTASDMQGQLLSALALAGGGLALLLVLIDETDNVFADIFSAATSTATVVKVKIKHLAIGFGILCTGIALFVAMDQFMSFLYMIGSVFTPLYGVLLVDHFIIRRRRIEADIFTISGPYGFTQGFHVAAFAAWISGIATYYYVLSYLPALGATLPAFAASAFIYWALRMVFTRPVIAP